MATKTAMHQDIRSLFQTGSEATVRRPLVRAAAAVAHQVLDDLQLRVSRVDTQLVGIKEVLQRLEVTQGSLRRAMKTNAQSLA